MYARRKFEMLWTIASLDSLVDLCTWVERRTVRIQSLAPEHNTISLARVRVRTTRSRIERTNLEDNVL